MSNFERTAFAVELFTAFLKSASLVLGAFCLATAYQSWEVGVGVASLVFFAKLK